MFDFKDYSGMHSGFSKKKDGSMHRFLEVENRKRYFESLGMDFTRIVTPDLVHGVGVAAVGLKDGGVMIPQSDGLVTNEKEVVLTATAADCFIIYVYDPIKQAIGIAHAGWRGVVAHMPQALIKKMVETFGSSPKDMQISLSPGIQGDHFEINSSDQEKFKEYLEAILKKEEKVFVDLPKIIVRQLKEVGILENNIEDSGVCTYCEKDQYFSYRRDKPKEVQPMVGYIVLG